MFVQVIQGKTNHAASLKKAEDAWLSDLAPHAAGWLGATSGVTADGTYIAIERFISAEAARRNSDRPEQGQWWEQTSKSFDGEATFHDCSTVIAVRGGARVDAGFVQVVQGRTDNIERLIALGEQMETTYRHLRPDLLGMLFARHDEGDGGFTMVAYFTNEAEARVGESQPAPVGAQEYQEAFQAAMVDVRYYDLTEPWTSSPM